jgi:hypothetical protein
VGIIDKRLDDQFLHHEYPDDFVHANSPQFTRVIGATIIFSVSCSEPTQSRREEVEDMKATASSIGKLLWAFMGINIVSGLIFRAQSQFALVAGYLFIFFMAYREKVFTEKSVKTPDKKQIMQMAAIVFATILSTITSSHFINPLLKNLGLHQDGSAYSEALGSGWYLFLLTVILAPLAEEILFRGILLKRLRLYGDSFAVLATAILFALQHTFLVQVGHTFLNGIVLAAVALRFGLLWAILIHALNNFLAVFALNAVQNEMVWLMKTIDIVYIGLGVLSIIYLFRLLYLNRTRMQEWWQENKPEQGLFRQFFVNGWLLPFVLIHVFLIILILFVPIGTAIAG